jgi:hypothetical protein
MLNIKPKLKGNKKRKLKMAEVRRTNQRFVTRLVRKVQLIIHKGPAPNSSEQETGSQPQPVMEEAAFKQIPIVVNLTQ